MTPELVIAALNSLGIVGMSLWIVWMFKVGEIASTKTVDRIVTIISERVETKIDQLHSDGGREHKEIMMAIHGQRRDHE